MDNYNVIIISVHAALTVGAVLARALGCKDACRRQTVRFFSGVLLAGFAATLVYFLALAGHLPLYTGYVLAGLVGWGGPELMDRVFADSPPKE